MLNRLPHTGSCPFGAHIVVELRDSSNHILRQFSGRAIVNVLGRGFDINAELTERRKQAGIINHITGETVELVNDDGVDFSVVLRDKVQELLQLRPVGCLCGFAFFNENPDDLITEPSSILFTDALL